MSAQIPLTIVTSTFNWPAALKLAIQTALTQTFTDFEYLVIGDGCTDETEEVVRNFDDQRVIWHNLPQNFGNQSDVNRVALASAKGEFIAYLNHDDLWFPDHLETLIEPMRKYHFDVANSVCLSIAPPGHHHRSVMGLPYVRGVNQRDVYPMTTTIMHTAEAARAVGGWTSWRDTPQIPTQDFFRRLRARRGAFGIISNITALKFHSGDRVNSYVTKDASEQARWLDLMRADPELRHRELMSALACAGIGEEPVSVPQPKVPQTPHNGWQVEQWRRIRGLAPMVDLGATEPVVAPVLPPQGPSLLNLEDGAWGVISPIFRP